MSVQRSERMLQRIGEQIGLSDDGKEWLKASLDPFHDNQICCNGYPDTCMSASVVQCVKQSVTIAAPPGITTGTWDLHVAQLPWFSSIQANSTSFPAASTNLLQQNADATSVVGGLYIMKVPTGTNYVIAGTATNQVNSSMVLPSTYYRGAARVVGSGFEITNTTAAINAQGLVTVYRNPMPMNAFNSTYGIVNSATLNVNAVGAASFVSMPCPPVTLAQSLLLPGSRQWAASEGSYQVCALNTDQLPIQGANYIQPLIYTTNADDTTQVTDHFAVTAVTNGTSPIAFMAHVEPTFWTQFDQSGCIFTGLSLASTLTLNWNVYVERFPSQEDNDLIVLAHASPAHDPKALEFYSIALRFLPVGVPVAENGLGDWFKSVINVASDYIAPIASLIPHPLAQGIATGIRGAKMISDSFDAPPSAGSAASQPRVVVQSAPRSRAILPGRPRNSTVKIEEVSTVMNKPKKKKKKTKAKSQAVVVYKQR